MRRSRFKAYLCLILLLSFSFTCFFSMVIVSDILDNDLLKRPDNLPDSFCRTLDKTAPEIKLNGDEMIRLKLGEEYKELGATAIDDCDEVELSINGKVDINTTGQYFIVYSSSDKSHNSTSISRIVNVAPEYHGTIYLTFDDGPGIYTDDLLDILAMYNVKATFFVTGAGDDSTILREFKEGHALALHTISHNYSYIYSSVDNFFEDLYAVQDRIKGITGFTTYLMRFPGGSSNTVSMRYDGGSRIMSTLVSEVENRGFTYFDWNVTSGDAGGASTAEEVGDNVIDRLVEYGESVVLQHDVKGFSVDAVERIIQYGLANGYEFKKLDANSFNAHHGVNN